MFNLTLHFLLSFFLVSSVVGRNLKIIAYCIKNLCIRQGVVGSSQYSPTIITGKEVQQKERVKLSRKSKVLVSFCFNVACTHLLIWRHRSQNGHIRKDLPVRILKSMIQRLLPSSLGWHTLDDKSSFVKFLLSRYLKVLLLLFVARKPVDIMECYSSERFSRCSWEKIE